MTDIPTRHMGFHISAVIINLTVYLIYSFYTAPQSSAAVQIVRALPPHLLLSILAAADPKPDADAMCNGTTNTAWKQLIFLLLLLPPASHHAILKGHLPELTSSRRLSVPELPAHPALDDTAPMRASLLVQVLSAAAVLAGGQPQRIWHSGATPTIPANLQLSPRGDIDRGTPLGVLVPQTSRKRRRDAPQPEVRAAADAGVAAEQAVAQRYRPPASRLRQRRTVQQRWLTSLELPIPTSSAPNIARSFGAISQLKTLCELTLKHNSKHNYNE